MKFSDDIHNKMQHIKLNDEERDAMDDAVLSFMEANPIQQEEMQKSSSAAKYVTNMKENITNNSQFFLSTFIRRLSYAALALVLTVAVGGGSVLASQNALPGDTLYGLKVNVAEELQSRFSPNEKVRAEWEAERVRRRLLEINMLLEKNGRVDDGVIEETKGHIDEHSNAVVLATNRLGALGDSDAILGIVVQLQETLETYKALLTSIVEQKQGSVNPEVLALLGNVEETGKAAEALQLGTLLDDVGYTEEEKLKDVIIKTTSIVQLTSPKTGDVLIQGQLFPITWDIDVSNGKLMTIQLLDKEGTIVGYVGANGFNVSSRKWNPQFIFGISDGRISSASPSVKPGVYSMLFTVETYDNKTYQYQTGQFSIISHPAYEALPQQEIVKGSEIIVSEPNAFHEFSPGQSEQVDIKWEVNDPDAANIPGYINLVSASGKFERSIMTLPALFKGWAVWSVPADLEPGSYRIEVGAGDYKAFGEEFWIGSDEVVKFEFDQTDDNVVEEDEAKKLTINFKQIVEPNGVIDSGNGFIMGAQVYDNWAKAEIAKMLVRCTKPAFIDTSFTTMRIEDVNGQRYGSPVTVVATSDTEQVAEFLDIAVPIPDSGPLDLRVRAYTLGDFPTHSVSCGVVYENDMLFRDLTDYSVSTKNINKGQYWDTEIIGTEDFGTEAPVWNGDEASMTWPQSFNSIIDGSHVNLAWKVVNSNINNEKGYLSLLTVSGEHVMDIGTVSSFSEFHYSWDVSIPNTVESGSYRIQLATDNGFSTVSEVFQLVSE